MPRPTVIPTFATDATLVAGPQIGQATRLDPGAARAQGIYQDEGVPARWLSWLFGTIGDWIGYFVAREHDAMRFTRTDLATGTDRMFFLSAVQQTTAIGSPANRQKSILVAGQSSGNLARIALLNDGTSPPVAASYHTLAGAALSSVPASDNSGVIFAGITGAGVLKTPDAGTTPSSVTVTGLAANATWVGFTTSHYLVYEGSTRKLFVATALAGTWTNTVLSASTTTINELVTDGAGAWLLLATEAGGTTIFRSTDDGATWVNQASLGAGAALCGGAWSDDRGLFVVFTGAGLMYTSPTGVTWTLTKTVAALNVAFGQKTVAVCGIVLAVVTNRTVNSLGKYPYGVAYSLDFGTNWFESYIAGADDSTLPIYSLLSANGRLYATDGISLYRSAIVDSPPVVFTGV